MTLHAAGLLPSIPDRHVLWALLVVAIAIPGVIWVRYIVLVVRNEQGALRITESERSAASAPRVSGSEALVFQINPTVSAAMEWSARFAAVLLLRHLATVEFSENRDRLFGPVEPINTNAVVGVGVFRNLEYIGRSVVMKFHGQRIRRKDVVSGVTAPLSGDVFICRRVGGQYPTHK